MLSWVNGAPGEQLSVRDRGLAYGDGLFETIAVRGGRIPLLARHMARLADGCRRLSIPLDLVLIEHELQAFAGLLGEGVAKLIVSRGEGQRGYAPPQPCQPLRILQAAPLPQYPLRMPSRACDCFPVRRVWLSNHCWPGSSTSTAWNRFWRAPNGRMPSAPKA